MHTLMKRWLAVIGLSLVLMGCGGPAPTPVNPPIASTAIVGQPYLLVIQGTQCTFVSGTLPVGLTMSGCIISGVPTQLGLFTFTVSVTQ